MAMATYNVHKVTDAIQLGCRTCANLKWCWITHKVSQLAGIDSQGVKPRGVITAGATLWGEFSSTMNLQWCVSQHFNAVLTTARAPKMPKSGGGRTPGERRQRAKQPRCLGRRE